MADSGNIPKHRCLDCGRPSARPIHPGCERRLDRRANKATKKVAEPPQKPGPGNLSKKWSETICCPRCGEIEKATVEFRAVDPFPIYVHQCRCGYTITESEWETVVV